MTVNWSRRGYSKEDFTEAWNSSYSISEVTKKLGANRSGSGFKTMRLAAEELGLTEDHMGSTSQLRSVGSASWGQPLSDILVEDSTYQNWASLKRRLWREGLLQEKCSAPFCPFQDVTVLNPFTGEVTELVLCLDHINGNNRDNRIENLRILCYHCHVMTDTFGSKNIALKRTTDSSSIN